jgi:hypothetical protein
MKSIREWMAENNMDSMNLTQFKNVAGGPVMEIDARLKSMLKPKLEQFIKEHDGEDPMSLFRAILATSAAILTDSKGLKVSTSKLLDALSQGDGSDNPIEDPNYSKEMNNPSSPY